MGFLDTPKFWVGSILFIKSQSDLVGKSTEFEVRRPEFKY